MKQEANTPPPPEQSEDVPEQQQGKATDIVTSDDYANAERARQAFQLARANMLNVNHWNELAAEHAPAQSLGGNNPLFPEFRLLHQGKPKHTSAGLNDVIEFAAGGQQMFVCIEALSDQPDEFAMRVRPCQRNGDLSDSEHMYTPAATTTFRLTREGNTLTTGFHGRNEVMHDDLFSHLVNAGMDLGGRRFTWGLLGRAWRPLPDKLN